jgi:hypothetical protein
MADSSWQSLGRDCSANDSSPIIMDFYQIVLFDPALCCILCVHPNEPIVVAVNINTVIRNVEEKAVLAVALGVEAIWSAA